MSRTYDCAYAEERADGVRLGAAALQRGELVVLPTDTVYGVAADAFSPEAVAALLAAKGRGRQSPPPVLAGGIDLLGALASSLSAEAKLLAQTFWPGALTLVCWAQPSLSWDLGDTGGTVALRVPDHPLTVELLRACGPLAVSSANRSGLPPGRTAAEAREQLGDSVAVYLEDGPAPGATASSIVDATGPVPRLVREGALSLARLREVVPALLGPDDPAPDDAAPDDPAPDGSVPDAPDDPVERPDPAASAPPPS